MASARTYPELLEATRRALARYGYGGATLERIASEAGVSRVTIHRRGLAKDDLLAALTELAIVDYRGRLWPALTAPGTGAHRLQLALRAVCEAAEEHLELLLALRAQADHVFHREDAGEVLTRTPFTEPLERILSDGIADGTLRPLDVEETATALFNMVGWTYVHLRTGHRWPPSRAARAVLDPVLRGVLAAQDGHEPSSAIGKS
jgi:AcrR family transcriptional regulator